MNKEITETPATTPPPIIPPIAALERAASLSKSMIENK
jgi:hypothetical protein